MQGLAGVRVLELGNLVSAAYAAKLMADLGAEVIKVEEPQGDHARRRGPFPGGAPHPEVGVQTHTGIPWRLTNAPNGVRKAAPVLGVDTDTVLREVLGHTDAEISKLKEQRVLY